MDKILEQEIGEKLDQERLGNEFARIEARLSSLMPRGMSDGFENEMGSLFCDLAEETNLVETTERDRSHWQGFAKVAANNGFAFSRRNKYFQSVGKSCS